MSERRARLARRHRLVPSTRTDDVAAIADSLVALHSSDPVSVFLSAMARMRHPSIAAVEDAARRGPSRDPVPRDAAHAVGRHPTGGTDGSRIVDGEARRARAPQVREAARRQRHLRPRRRLDHVGEGAGSGGAAPRRGGVDTRARRGCARLAATDRAVAGQAVRRDATRTRAHHVAPRLRGCRGAEPPDGLLDQQPVPLGGDGRMGAGGIVGHGSR